MCFCEAGTRDICVAHTQPLRSLSPTERIDHLIFTSSNGAGGPPFVLLALHVIVLCTPLYITSVCAGVWRTLLHSPELRFYALFKLQPDLALQPFSSAHIPPWRCGQLCCRFTLSDSSHGCLCSCGIVSACIVTGTAQEMCRRRNFCLKHPCGCANESAMTLLPIGVKGSFPGFCSLGCNLYV